MGVSAYKELSTIGAKIRDARKSSGLNQETLAHLSNLSRRTIHLAESGKGAIRLDSLIQILDALGLRLSIASKRGLSVGSTQD